MKQAEDAHVVADDDGGALDDAVGGGVGPLLLATDQLQQRPAERLDTVPLPATGV